MDVCNRQAMGYGRQRTSMSNAILANPFQRKKATSSIQYPGKLGSQNFGTGEHDTIDTIVQDMKYEITRPNEIQRAQRKVRTTPKIR